MVWMLSLALPLAGWAAAAPALAFGGMHAFTADDPASASTAAQALPCHALPSDLPDEPGNAAGGHAGCAQCAVCHAGSAPAPTLAAAPAPRPGAAAVPRWEPPHLITVDTGGLDRPPRTRLA